MNKSLIIAEKPSVCANIAHSVGAYEKIFSPHRIKGITAYINDRYIVAHSVGHLYSIGEPTDYGFSKSYSDSYKKGELPMFPEKFNIIAPKEANQEDQKYKDELRKFLESLINRSDVDEIIEATDAAREGELIFREIYYHSQTYKPVRRLWISSVTDEAIQKGLNNMKSMSAYDNIYKTAKLRQMCDWYVGMNMSRLYTALDDIPERVGRIMTPLLGIIVERDEKIESFQSTTSYRVMLKGLQSEQIYAENQKAQEIIEQSIGSNAVVEESSSKEKSENRPLLYSLATLQMDGNAIYGMTAQEVLKTAQDLYEKRYTTYPRTDSEHLSDDMRNEVVSIVDKLADQYDYAQQIKQQGLNMDNRIFDNDKISDHHAIIPTNIAADISKLSDNEKNVYNLIANRLLMALDKPYRYIEHKIVVDCNGLKYSGKSREPIEMGFKAHVIKNSDDKEEDSTINIMQQGESFVVESEDISIKEVVSEAPRHFTDKTLLSVMSNIDNRIEGTELKAAVKGKGLGTSATRAEIIEKLISSGYCERQKKYIVSKQYGRDFVHSLPIKLLSVEMTAQWEQLFEDIASGTDRTDELLQKTKTLITSILEYEKSNTERKKVTNSEYKPMFAPVVVGKCWRCGEDVLAKKGFFGCSSYKDKDNKGCGFVFSRAHIKGFYIGEISDKQASDLLNRKSIKLKSVSREGKEYTAEWKLSDDIQYVNVIKVQPKKETLGQCPWCGKNICESEKSFFCAGYKEGCGFTIWKTQKYLNVTVTTDKVKDLLLGKEVYFTKNGQQIKYKLGEGEYNGKRITNLVEVKE